MPVENLKVVVTEGEGGINNIRQHTGQTPAVRVEDEQQHPLAGAVVVFALPTDGPGGTFANGAKTLTVNTDDKGIAAIHGFKPNSVAGEMLIHVNASYQGRTGRATITQFNMTVPSAKGGNGKLLVILAIAGAAAAGGAYAGLHKSGSSPSTSGTIPAGPTPISITPGTGTVGPPQ